MCCSTLARLSFLGLLVSAPFGRSEAGEPSRVNIAQALQRSKVLHPDRQLVHFSHACSLHIDGADYPVVNVFEQWLVSGTVHGVHKIAVLGPDLRLRTLFDNLSADVSGLFCVGDRLYLRGELGIANAEPYGNIIELREHGWQPLVVGSAPESEYPLLFTRERKQLR